MFKRRAPQLRRVHLNAFPAVHLKRMDVLDFGVKFSSELLVMVIALAVAGLNFHFFDFGDLKNYSDKSLAANFLALHPVLNKQLSERNNTVITVFTATNLIPQAQADELAGLDSQSGFADSTSNDAGGLEDNGIAAPNPDSIQALVTNVTKKVYTTQPGDSLKSIAQKNGISVNSILWSNPNLSSDVIKPGWDLIIPPVDGIAVTADANTTLPDLAAQFNPEKYNTDKKARDASAAKLLEIIISYNGLDSAEAINPGDFLIIPGGVVAQAPTPKPTPKPKTSKPSTPTTPGVTSISSGYDADNHYFPIGYCTYYVATRMKITFGGNAKNWLSNARASGYVTGQEPAANAAIVFGTKGYGRYGHVAFVEQVDGNRVLVSEMNYEKFNRVNQRWVSTSDPAIQGYIYP